MMRDLLLSYVTNTTIEDFDNFTKMPVITDTSRYIWKTMNDGVLLISSSDKVLYLTNDGYVHKLTTIFTPQDFVNHNKLLSIANNIRMDIPISQETIDSNHKKYCYSVVKRPGGQPGISFWQDLANKVITVDYIKQYIDETTELLTVLKSMNTLVPIVGFSMDKRMRDDKGFFWGDFKMWTVDMDRCVNKTLTVFREYMYLLERSEYQGLAGLVEMADEKWKMVLTQ